MSDAETGSQVEEKPTGRVIPFSGKLTVADVYAAIALMEPRSTKVKRWCLAIFGATLFCFFGWLLEVPHSPLHSSAFFGGGGRTAPFVHRIFT